MKKRFFAWIKKKAPYILGVALHSLWLGASFKYDMTGLQHGAGHSLIGLSTGVTLGYQSDAAKTKVKKTIEKAKNIFKTKDPK